MAIIVTIDGRHSVMETVSEIKKQMLESEPARHAYFIEVKKRQRHSMQGEPLLINTAHIVSVTESDHTGGW